MLILCVVVGTVIFGAVWLHRRRNTESLILALNSARSSSHENPTYVAPAVRPNLSSKRGTCGGPVGTGPLIAEALRAAMHVNPTCESAGTDATGAPDVVYAVPTADSGAAAMYAATFPSDPSLFGIVNAAYNLTCADNTGATLPDYDQSIDANDDPATVSTPAPGACRSLDPAKVCNVASREADVDTMAPCNTAMSFAIPTEEGGSVIYSTADDTDDGMYASPAAMSFVIPTEKGGSVIYSTADDTDDGMYASPAAMGFLIPTEEGGSVIYSTADDTDDGLYASPAAMPTADEDAEESTSTLC